MEFLILLVWAVAVGLVIAGVYWVVRLAIRHERDH